MPVTFRCLFAAGVRNLGWRRAILRLPQMALCWVRLAWLHRRMERNMARVDWSRARVGVPVAWTAEAVLPGTEQNEVKPA